MRRNRKMRNTIILMVVVTAVLSIIVPPVKANLLALWKFEESTNDHNAIDSGPVGGHNGMLMKGPKDPNSPIDSTYPKRISRTVTSKALEFGKPSTGNPAPGAGNRNWNYVAIPAKDDLKKLSANWTIAFWTKQYVNDPNVHYGGLNDANGTGYQRVLSCPSYEIEYGIPGNPPDLHDYLWPFETPDWEMQIGSSMALNVWHHFALTYDGTTLRRYVDANETFNYAINNSLPEDIWGTEALTIGCQTYPIKDFFIGAIDDVAIFNECLDQTQLRAIRNGNFTGPWITWTYEPDLAGSYLWDYTFIGQTDRYALNMGQKRKGTANSVGIPSWNWIVIGDLSDPNKFGLVNAGLLDGDNTTAEYAAYIPVGNKLVQPKPADWSIGFAGDFKDHRRIHKNTKYNIKARFAGDVNAVGNVAGVKVYAVEANDPNNKSLLADLSETVTTAGVWIPKTFLYTADAATYPLDNKVFYVECYINQGSGSVNGKGWFDYVRIDVNSFMTCEALYTYNNGTDPCLPYDITKDCKMDFRDLASFANNWAQKNDPEPITNSTELLVNNDFYANKVLVPAAGNTNKATPTGWTFVPAVNDANEAGVWNVSARGVQGWPEVAQPAGGTVAAFIDPNIQLQQVTSATIVNGQTYYLSAMLGGVEFSYQNVLKVIYEYVNTPVSPSTVVQIAVQDYNTLPDRTAWRRFCTTWTAPPAAAGKYFRVRAVYGAPYLSGFTPARRAWGLIGNISINTVKPAFWQRTNLLTNGDFEDYSNLPMGDLSGTDGWLRLIGTNNGWNWNFGYPDYAYPPGWTAYEDIEDGGSNYTEGGLQCMLWAPPPQPGHGHGICAVLGHAIDNPDIVELEQKVTSETIQTGQNYYLDFIGCISAQAYNDGDWQWPTPDPNIIVDLYWLAPGQADIHSGTPGVNYGLITSLKKPADAGMGANGGHWQIGKTSFSGTAYAGKNFYVVAYGEAPYTTFEEIYLSKESPQTTDPYTCPELRSMGTAIYADYTHDCIVNFADVDVFVSYWLQCNDPAGCM